MCDCALLIGPEEPTTIIPDDPPAQPVDSSDEVKIKEISGGDPN